MHINILCAIIQLVIKRGLLHHVSNKNNYLSTCTVFWHCRLGGRKGIRPVKTRWWGAGVVIRLQRGADLHNGSADICHCHSLYLASIKSRLVLPFWYRLTRVVSEKLPLNVCVCTLRKLASKAGMRPRSSRKRSNAKDSLRVTVTVTGDISLTLCNSADIFCHTQTSTTKLRCLFASIHDSIH